jgi:hypothetical protein
MQSYNLRSYVPGFLTGCVTVQREVAALVVVEILEAKKFALQVASIPKGYEVEIISPDCPDEPFHKRV